MTEKRNYTEVEISAIRARYVAEGANQLAREMGRDPRHVRAKAWMLGLRRDLKKRNRAARDWLPEEDGLIRAEWSLIQRRVRGHTVPKLAARMGVTECMIRNRAAAMGIRNLHMKNNEWSEAEIELLDRYAHLSAEAVYRRFLAAGYRRTSAAIQIMRNRHGFGANDSSNAYSATRLAALMGVSSRQVCRWISMGLLKAAPRTDAIDPRHGGVGDRWLIYPRHVKAFIRDHAIHIPIAQADKVWLIDLLVGGETVTHIQHSAGIADSGLSEMRIAA